MPPDGYNPADKVKKVVGHQNAVLSASELPSKKFIHHDSRAVI